MKRKRTAQLKDGKAKKKRKPNYKKANEELPEVPTPEELSKIGPKLHPFMFKNKSDQYKRNFKYYWEELKPTFTKDDNRSWVLVKDCKLVKKVAMNKRGCIKWSDITNHDYYVQIGMHL
jgi:hypothetical protein